MNSFASHERSPHPSRLCTRVLGIGFALGLLSSTAISYAQSSTSPESQTPQLGPSTNASASPDLFTGSLSTSIPIEVPSGRQGVQPALALTYRSGGPNGWLG